MFCNVDAVPPFCKRLRQRQRTQSLQEETPREDTSMPRIILALAFAAMVANGAMPAAAQQEITLTVAAGQPLRAMNPLNLVSEFYIPEVNKRIEAAGLDIKVNWKEAYAGSLLKPTFVLQGGYRL
jgi:hypothetical protein